MSPRLWFCIALSLAFHAAVILFAEDRNSPPRLMSRVTLTYHVAGDTKPRNAAKPAAQLARAGQKAPAEPASPPTPDEVQPAVEPSRYASPDEVDSLATILEPPSLPLPTDLTLATGHAMLRIFVGPEGTPDFVDVEESTFPDDYNQAIALQFEQARFAPATISGIPIRSWRRIEVRLD
jgi:hypothetical protein